MGLILRKSNIPQHDSVFVGREKEIKTIIDNLKSRFFLVEITGMGGIGKTAIAIEVGERCLKKRLFDNIIWVSAKYDTLDISRLLKAINTFEYGFTGEELPIDEATLLAKRILAAGKIILVLDNYEDVEGEQIANFLREVPGPSKVLLTTRHSKIKEATTIRLSGLKKEDCIKIARNEIDRLSIETMKNAKDADLLQLSEITFGIPFLIKWVMGQVKFGHKYEEITNALSLLKPEASKVYDYVFEKSFKGLDKTAIQILITLSLSKNPVSYDFIVGVVNPTAPHMVKENVDLLISQNLLEIKKAPIGAI